MFGKQARALSSQHSRSGRSAGRRAEPNVQAVLLAPAQPKPARMTTEEPASFPPSTTGNNGTGQEKHGGGKSKVRWSRGTAALKRKSASDGSWQRTLLRRRQLCPGALRGRQVLLARPSL